MTTFVPCRPEPADPSICAGDTLVYENGAVLIVIARRVDGGLLRRTLSPREVEIATERIEEHRACPASAHREVPDGSGGMCVRFVFAYGADQ